MNEIEAAFKRRIERRHLKRVQLDYDGSVTHSSDNHAEGYGEQHIKGDDLSSLRIVGRVKRHIRSLE